MHRIVPIDSSHLIDIVVFHRVDKLLNKRLVQLEPAEVLCRVLVRDGLNLGELVVEVACALDELAHFGVVVGRTATHVSNVASYDALTGHGWNQAVQQEEHGGIVMHDLSDEALALLHLDERVNRELDVLAVADVLQVRGHAPVKEINLLKHVIEALDDIVVTLLEAVVQLAQLN